MVEQKSALRGWKKTPSIIWPILIGLAWRDFGWRADALTLSLFLAFNRNCWQAVVITVGCRPVCPLRFIRYQHGEWPVERQKALELACCCCFCEGRWLKLTGWDAVLSVRQRRLRSGAVVFWSTFSFFFHSDWTWTTPSNVLCRSLVASFVQRRQYQVLHLQFVYCRSLTLLCLCDQLVNYGIGS